MEKKNCPDCKLQVAKWNELCNGCGYTVVLEPDAKVRARYLRGPSLGALLFTQGWAFGARTYFWFLLSLVPVVGLVSLFVLLVLGRRISWEHGGWGSWDEFQTRMRFLDRIGMVWITLLFILYLWRRFAL